MTRTTQIKTLLGLTAAAAVLFAFAAPSMAGDGYGPSFSSGHRPAYAPVPAGHFGQPNFDRRDFDRRDFDRRDFDRRDYGRPTWGFDRRPVMIAPPVRCATPLFYPQPVVIERPIVVTRTVYVSRPAFGISFGIGW